MGNIAQWLREAEQHSGEIIDAICIGEHDDDRYEDIQRSADMLNRVLSRDEGLTVLDVEYDDGFGGADCFPMYAWSASWIYFITEYDGSTQLGRLPRSPIDCEPYFDGETQC